MIFSTKLASISSVIKLNLGLVIISVSLSKARLVSNLLYILRSNLIYCKAYSILELRSKSSDSAVKFKLTAKGSFRFI